MENSLQEKKLNKTVVFKQGIATMIDKKNEEGVCLSRNYMQ